MPAKFVLKKGTTGKFRFNLVAPNGQSIATSEAYETKASAMAGIASVRKNAAGATTEDLTAPAAPAKPVKPVAKKAPKKAPAATKAPARKASARKAPARKAAKKG